MKYTGAEITIKLLEKQGISIVAGIPGGANLPIYDALYKSKIKHIMARHEQGAGFIAHGMARSTGRAAVCLATSGPEATNLLTAIADAKLDSIPIIAITGQVATSFIGTDAFQEVDTYGLTLPITKHNFLVRSANELLTVVPEAFRIAQSGRPGPVAIDIPKDVQLEKIEIEKWPNQVKVDNSNSINESNVEQVADFINKAKRPLLYIGGGIIHSNASEILYRLAKKNSIPLTSTLMGLGCFPSDDPLYLGMLGMHGARYTNLILSEIDLLLAFGVRFDDRATGNIEEFCGQARIVHIDIDPSEIDKLKQLSFSIVGDIGMALRQMIPFIDSNSRRDWISRIGELRAEHPFLMPDSSDPLHPINLIRSISSLVKPDTVITTDVGQHQMWVAQVYPFRRPRSLLTSGGLGTMGFGVPVAIGAALVNPDKRIVCISGDGSFFMNMQELATLAELNLDVTVIIMNNGHLGLVRQQQELFYEKQYIASRFTTELDVVSIGRAFGIRSYYLKRTDDPIAVLARSLSDRGPSIVNVPINEALNVTPMVPPGAANYEMIGGDKDD